MLVSVGVVARKCGAVGHFEHVVARGAEIDLARHDGLDRIRLRCRRLRRKPDIVLADRDRGALARRKRGADHLQGHARKGDVVAVARGALDDIAGADEARHEFGFGPRVNILGRAELVDPAAVHDRDQVGRGHGLGLVVGDVDGGVAIFVMQAADFEPHLLAQISIEIGQRLVEQQRLRFDDQGARQRHALLLSAGEFAGIALRQRFELGRGQNRREFFRNGVAVHFAQAQAVDDVFGHRHVRPQRVALEDHRHVALFGRQRARFRGHQPVADMDLAVGRFQETRDQPQRRGLAAAGGAEQADQLSMVDFQGDVIDHRKRGKALGQATQINRRQSSPPVLVLAGVNARLGMPVYGQLRVGKGALASEAAK